MKYIKLIGQQTSLDPITSPQFYDFKNLSSQIFTVPKLIVSPLFIYH